MSDLFDIGYQKMRKLFQILKYISQLNTQLQTTLKTILFGYNVFIEVVSIDLTLRWNHSCPKLIYTTQKIVQSFNIARHFILTFWSLRGYFWLTNRWNWVMSTAYHLERLILFFNDITLISK